MGDPQTGFQKIRKSSQEDYKRWVECKTTFGKHRKVLAYAKKLDTGHSTTGK